jgi:pyruvate dehydrogenase E2 component (dihydrolipoamide acetyltransferase)
MPFKLELPDIGEGVVEAEIQKWFVAEGDQVHEDQPLVEVMTDKATVVIPSPRRGRVLRRFWKEGEVAKVHAPLVELELEEGAPRAAPEAPVRAAVAAAASSAAITSPSPVGREDAPAAEARAEPQKALATPAVRALAREMGIDVNAVEATGPGGRVTKEDLAQHRGGRNAATVHRFPMPTPAAAAQSSRPSPPRSGGEGEAPRVQARPFVGGFDEVAPGREGEAPRVQAGPLVGVFDEVAPGREGVAPREGAALRGRDGEAPDERIPLKGVRRKIAENMARSKRTAAHFTFVEQADVTELVRVKERIAAAAKDEGVKVTFLPFVVKAVVAALRKHPKLNAMLDEERGELVLRKRYDLGIAAATEGGLVVPVVRGAERLSLLDLAREIERLSADAKTGRSRPEDMGHSTFTITSLGALGGLFATPVLNHPEVGILGLHRIRPTPVVKDGQIVVRDVMHVSVTSDHRVVDGHEAAAFAYEVIRLLEAPDLLFMRMV